MSKLPRRPSCRGRGQPPARVLKEPRFYELASGRMNEFLGRGICPVCRREVCFYAKAGCVHHVATRVYSTRSRLAFEARRIEMIKASMDWTPSGSMVIALRWWFRDYGGADAFRRFEVESLFERGVMSDEAFLAANGFEDGVA